MRTASLPATPIGLPRSKRLVSLAGDERLVEQIRRGDELAFEVAFERHSPALLSFCRHMLGSREEAEDAVQQVFTSAYKHLQSDDREINLKPWLFAIARNRCLSMLRVRRDQLSEPPEIPIAGLAEQAERRGDLRDLLRDLRELPVEQRAALLLSEVSGLSHAEIGGVLGCEAPKVKTLVFRARSGLIERREARESPCDEIRQQLANLRGGSLRRGRLRHHLRVCEGCREYRVEVRRQRQLLAAVLPVIPSPGLKEGVLSALGLGGGSAGGGALLGGLGAATTSGAGSATVAKVAILGALTGGGAVAGDAIVDHSRVEGDRAASVATQDPTTATAPRGVRLGTDEAAGAQGGWIGEGKGQHGRAGAGKAHGGKRHGESRGAKGHGRRGGNGRGHEQADHGKSRGGSHGGKHRGGSRRAGGGGGHAPRGNANGRAPGGNANGHAPRGNANGHAPGGNANGHARGVARRGGQTEEDASGVAEAGGQVPAVDAPGNGPPATRVAK
jgi:RNA polymerase sigma factor (sigma-70 family)